MAAEPPNLRRLLDDDQVVALCEAQRAEQPTDLHPLKRLAVAAFEAGEVLIGHDLRARPCLQEAYVLLWIQLHVQCPPLSGCLRRAIDRHHPGPGAIRSGADQIETPRGLSQRERHQRPCSGNLWISRLQDPWRKGTETYLRHQTLRFESHTAAAVVSPLRRYPYSPTCRRDD